MALVTRSTDASLDTVSATKVPQLPNLPALVAGEDLDKAAPCYIHTDGKVYMSNGTAANAAAAVIGFTGAKGHKAGEPVTLWGPGAIFHYSDDFGATAPGSKLYVATTKGRLDTAATTGDAVGVARVLDKYHIVVSRGFGQ